MKNIIANNVPTESIQIKDLPQDPVIGAFVTRHPAEKYFLLVTSGSKGRTHSMFHVGGLGSGMSIWGGKEDNTLAKALSDPQLTYLLFDTPRELFAWLADESTPSA